VVWQLIERGLNDRPRGRLELVEQTLNDPCETNQIAVRHPSLADGGAAAQKMQGTCACPALLVRSRTSPLFT